MSRVRFDQSKLSELRDPSSIADLLKSIEIAGARPVDAGAASEEQIADYIDSVHQIGLPGMYDIFISVPMSSVAEDEYDEFRSTIESLAEAMKRDGRRVYCGCIAHRSSRGHGPRRTWLRRKTLKHSDAAETS